MEIDRWTRPLCSRSSYERKLLNYGALEASFDVRDEHSHGLPMQIHVEPTGECQLDCPICPRGRQLIRRTGHLSLESFRRAIEPTWDGLCNLVLSGFGEPLLNPATPAMIALATKHGVSTVMNSNGLSLAEHATALLDSGLTVINLSLDGAVSRSCHRYSTAHPFSRVIKGVEVLRKAKDRGECRYPIILGQFVVTEETIEEMPTLQDWAHCLGVEQVRFKRMHHTMPGERRRGLLFSECDLERLGRRPGVDSSEKLGWSPVACSHPWDSLFLSCTGELGLCSFDAHQSLRLDHSAGDIEATWNGDALRRVRRAHRGRTEDMGEPCARCNRLPGYFTTGAFPA
jgi:pyruvate-formate lyase-activating enzyme